MDVELLTKQLVLLILAGKVPRNAEVVRTTEWGQQPVKEVRVEDGKVVLS